MDQKTVIHSSYWVTSYWCQYESKYFYAAGNCDVEYLYMLQPQTHTNKLLSSHDDKKCVILQHPVEKTLAKPICLVAGYPSPTNNNTFQANTQLDGWLVSVTTGKGSDWGQTSREGKRV